MRRLINVYFKRITLLVICIIITGGYAVAASSPTIAVLNFTNNTGSKGMDYLSTALADSISATLSQSEDIQVVERSRLSSVINQVELEQSGMFSKTDISRAERMTNADVLLLGSYSGTPSSITLIIKAVDIKTALVLNGRVVTAHLSELFDSANQAAGIIAAVVSTKDVGRLTVSTSPDECDIYIDGMMAGKSPLIEYKLPAGEHRIRAVKKGYIDDEVTLAIRTNGSATWNPVLPEKQVLNRSEFSVGVSALIPANKDLTPSPVFLAAIGHNFDRWNISGEIGFSRISHDQVFQHLGSEVEQDRWYNYTSLNGHIAYILYTGWKLVTPYAGIFAGYGKLVDYRSNEAYEDGEEKLRSHNLLSLGGRLGANILSLGKFSLFVEGRYYYTPTLVTRDEYQSQGVLGGLIKSEQEYRFNYVTMGGGLKYYF